MRTFLLILLLLPVSIFAQSDYKRLKVTEDIELIKLSKNAYVHVSTHEFPSFGKVSSNGLILIHEGDAILFDTPVTNIQTDTLYKFVANRLKSKITKFVPTHWHDDCMGGIDTLKAKGVRSYANEKTISIAKEKGLTQPMYSFKKTQELALLGNFEANCHFLGAGHTLDNIVVWIPSEKILFGGCLLKDLSASGLGNIADADVKAWPKTIEKILKKFSDAKIVIPGHGEIGGIELVKHTLELVQPK